MPPPTSNTALDPWTPESELREAPPRRTAALEEDYPDLNRPSLLLYVGVGAAIMLVGLILLFVGFARGKVGLGIFGGVLLLGGAVLVGLYPTKQRSHDERIERLINFGVPVRARILAADNMTGDSAFGRSVKYQIVTPTGDMVHRSVNADERRLPKTVPGDATALMDMQSGDAELYCALPRRAIIREATSVPVAVPPTYTPNVPAAQPTIATVAPVTQPVAVAEASTASTAATPVLPTRMETMAGMTPVRPTDNGEAAEIVAPVVASAEPSVLAPESPDEDKEREEKKESAGTSGLPWE